MYNLPTWNVLLLLLTCIARCKLQGNLPHVKKWPFLVDLTHCCPQSFWSTPGRDRDLWLAPISEHVQSNRTVIFSQSHLSDLTMCPLIVDFQCWGGQRSQFLAKTRRIATSEDKNGFDCQCHCTCWMKLHKLHVLVREPCSCHHSCSISCAGVC